MRNWLSDLAAAVGSGVLKLVDASFSYKYHVFLVATVALFAHIIDGWVWLSAAGLFMGARQLQHNAQHGAWPFVQRSPLSEGEERE